MTITIRFSYVAKIPTNLNEECRAYLVERFARAMLGDSTNYAMAYSCQTAIQCMPTSVVVWWGQGAAAVATNAKVASMRTKLLLTDAVSWIFMEFHVFPLISMDYAVAAFAERHLLGNNANVRPPEAMMTIPRPTCINLLSNFLLHGPGSHGELIHGQCQAPIRLCMPRS